ncbi:MAG: exodeoxyribonuclease VII small subunit [Ruminococcaceae bacterium]|nr:exodeoxyribonuclease VII small subunit [Oscillospiraceae bacterium]
MSEKKALTFEEALARLEEIVRELENGAAPLDRSLAMFEEGVALVKLCGNHLDEAERRIAVLTKTENGNYEEKPFGDA